MKTLELDIYLVDCGLHLFRDMLSLPDYGMIILDEVLVAIEFGLLNEKALCKVLEMRPHHTHVVLTGRNAPKRILDIADLVTEMKEIEHLYKVGIKGQIGIEY